MIKIEYVLSGSDATMTCNDTIYQVTSGRVGQRYSEEEGNSIVVNSGAVAYITEDGELVVVGSGTKKTTIVTAPAVKPSLTPVAQPIPPKQ
jgi:hypothetical protein